MVDDCREYLLDTARLPHTCTPNGQDSMHNSMDREGVHEVLLLDKEPLELFTCWGERGRGVGEEGLTT